MKRSAFVEYLLEHGCLPGAPARSGHVKVTQPRTGAWSTLPPDPETPPALARGICRVLGIAAPPEVSVRRGRSAPAAKRGRPRKRRD